MTPEERQMLGALVDRIKSAPAQDIDAEADQVIRQLTQARPDTAYLLAQTVLMQDFALRNAQAQIADLQRQVQETQAQPKSSGSFLGGLFGGGQPAPAASVPQSNPWARPAPAYAAPQPAYAAGYAPVVMQPTQTSGFLRSAATTAVGIAGGALLFEGIQSLFSGHGGYGGFGGGYGGGFGGGFGGGPWGDGPRESLSETTIINNNTNYNYNDGDRPADTTPDTSFNDPGLSQPDSGFQDATDYGSDSSGGDFGGGDGFSGGGSDDYV